MSPRSNGVREAVDDPRSLRAGSGPARVRRRSAGGERRACALERALDRASVVSSISALCRPEAEHVAQHERRALQRRQLLQPGDERERGRLFRLVARRRPGRGVGEAFEQDVRERLEPERLGVAGRLGGSGIGGISAGGAGRSRRWSRERFVAIR